MLLLTVKFCNPQLPFFNVTFNIVLISSFSRSTSLNFKSRLSHISSFSRPRESCFLKKKNVLELIVQIHYKTAFLQDTLKQEFYMNLKSTGVALTDIDAMRNRSDTLKNRVRVHTRFSCDTSIGHYSRALNRCRCTLYLM